MSFSIFDETAHMGEPGEFCIWHWLVPQRRPYPMDLAEYLREVGNWLIQVWIKDQDWPGLGPLMRQSICTEEGGLNRRVW